LYYHDHDSLETALESIKKEYKMSKGICLVTLVLLICGVTLPAFAQSVTTKPKGQNEWEHYLQALEASKSLR
jgi:hypothetical protein